MVYPFYSLLQINLEYYKVSFGHIKVRKEMENDQKKKKKVLGVNWFKSPLTHTFPNVANKE